MQDCIVLTSKSMIKNAIIIIKLIINIAEIELLKIQQSNVINTEEINAPMLIDKKAYITFKFVSPAIKLPLHTPVSGKGIATKQVNAIYFLKFEALFSI